jgi:class 3 adenylate cyclase
MRVGGYGGLEHSTYGAIGEQTNLAARLMQVAAPGELLADHSVIVATDRETEFESARIQRLKGITRDLRVYRYARQGGGSPLDELNPLLGAAALAAVHPEVPSDRHLDD